ASDLLERRVSLERKRLELRRCRSIMPTCHAAPSVASPGNSAQAVATGQASRCGRTRAGLDGGVRLIELGKEEWNQRMAHLAGDVREEGGNAKNDDVEHGLFLPTPLLPWNPTFFSPSRSDPLRSRAGDRCAASGGGQIDSDDTAGPVDRDALAGRDPVRR